MSVEYKSFNNKITCKQVIFGLQVNIMYIKSNKHNIE